MKYALFICELRHEKGGWSDFVDASDSIETLESIVWDQWRRTDHALRPEMRAQIVDLSERRCIRLADWGGDREIVKWSIVRGPLRMPFDTGTSANRPVEIGAAISAVASAIQSLSEAMMSMPIIVQDHKPDIIR